MMSKRDTVEATVKGSSQMFYMKNDFSGWNSVTVHNKRVRPDDHSVFVESSGIVAVVCSNLDNNNNKSRGHAMMVFREGTWQLFFVWKLSGETLHGFEAELESPTRFTLFEKMYNLEVDLLMIMKFVSIYGLEDPRMDNYAFLNTIDGKLNIGSKPTTMMLPRPTLYEHVRHSEVVVERPSRKRKKRGGRKQSNRNVPANVVRRIRNGKNLAYLDIYVGEKALNDGPLAELTEKVKLINKDKNVKPMEKEMFLLPKVIHDLPSPCSTFKVVSFYVVSKRMVMRMNNMLYEDTNLLLSSCDTVDLISIPYSDRIVRISVCSEEEYETLRSMGDVTVHSFGSIGSFLTRESSDYEVDIPGFIVSTWELNSEMTGKFDMADLKEFQNRFGTFFGNRPSVPCGGINGYLGCRNSFKPTLSPALGPGTIFSASYHRKHYLEDHKHPHLCHKVRCHAKEAQSLAYRYAGTLMHFVGYDTCSRLIWTQGSCQRTARTLEQNEVRIKTEMVDSLTPLGFFNIPHKDKCDLLSKNEYGEWMRELELMQKSDKEVGKIKRMDLSVGIGLPTVCAYNEISEGKGCANAWFADMLFCAQIHNGTLHYFCGWASPHCTCVPIVRMNDHVRTMNTAEGDRTFIAGWGSSGGSPEARAAREARREERERRRILQAMEDLLGKGRRRQLKGKKEGY
jgi:hypothetical protein